MWIEQPPARAHPLVDDGTGALAAALDTVVELYPLRPDLPIEAFLAWTSGQQLLVGGTTTVLLPGTRPAAQRLVGLGDYAARDDRGRTWAEPAAGIAQRYALA